MNLDVYIYERRLLSDRKWTTTHMTYHKNVHDDWLRYFPLASLLAQLFACMLALREKHHISTFLARNFFETPQMSCFPSTSGYRTFNSTQIENKK